MKRAYLTDKAREQRVVCNAPPLYLRPGIDPLIDLVPIFLSACPCGASLVDLAGRVDKYFNSLLLLQSTVSVN